MMEQLNELVTIVTIYFLLCYTGQFVLDLKTRDQLGIAMICLTVLNFLINSVPIILSLKDEIQRRYRMSKVNKYKKELQEKMQSRSEKENSFNVFLEKQSTESALQKEALDNIFELQRSVYGKEPDEAPVPVSQIDIPDEFKSQISEDLEEHDEEEAEEESDESEYEYYREEDFQEELQNDFKEKDPTDKDILNDSKLIKASDLEDFKEKVLADNDAMQAQ